MTGDPLERIIPLPPITIRQLHTIAGALQLAGFRYPLLLQLRRWDDDHIDPLSHDDLTELTNDFDQLVQEVKPLGPDERHRRWRLFGRRAPSNAHRLKNRRDR